MLVRFRRMSSINSELNPPGFSGSAKGGRSGGRVIYCPRLRGTGMARKRLVSLLSALLLLPLFGPAAAQDLRREESEDYYARWLREDAVYIVTDDEKAVFESLTTPEEKERFIEQFWHRRDPDPRTAENEFKVEHYRRLAYASERFASGFPGWRTDRGRVYIIHGPPSKIESRASGGAYQRPMTEGGGVTATFPFEIWHYRSIPGVGDDIQLEFVDRSLSGEYRLALRPEEKDALLHVPGQGMTAAEELGIATKADRPFFNPLKRDYPMMEDTARDNPFHRYETFTMVQRPPEIKYGDLRELVKVDVRYDSLPFRLEPHYLYLSPDRVLVPVTVQLENKDLTFVEQNGALVGQVAIYGVVTTISNRLVTEFEDDLVATPSSEDLRSGSAGRSAYQRILSLDARQRYRLDLVVKDLNSGKTGVSRSGLIPPALSDRELSTSSVILADAIDLREDFSEADEMFVIGDLKVLPNLDHTFQSGGLLGIYFQVYNSLLDQSTFQPSLGVSYRLLKDGRVIRQTADAEGESIQYHSPRRIVCVRLLSLAGLEAGVYELQITVEDRLSGGVVQLGERLSIREPRQTAMSR